VSGPSPYAATSAEVRRVLEAERSGEAFLLYRDGAGEQRIAPLERASGRLTIGRRSASDLPLAWDGEVSRVHCELEWIGGDWTVSDDGLSRNGTFVDDERLTERRRLRDGEVLRVGDTRLVFRNPAEGVSAAATVDAAQHPELAPLNERQRAILAALARPFVDAPGLATPATNREIADAVHLSVDAVKGHLRVLYQRFELDELPQHEKRVRLAERALRDGLARRNTAV
jgi:pSer/pThr/pTyr-binding forkhead associated (FHA) protein